MSCRRFVRAGMARMVAVAVIAAAAWPAPAARAADGGTDPAEAFVAGFEDLPLMPGLRQLDDAGMVFDAPSGRVVEAWAQGPVTSAEVVAFYDETLPQLGWRPLGGARYRREGELLQLEITAGAGAEAGAPITVRFYLAPD